MRYILDSDTITYLFNPSLKEHSNVFKRIGQLENNDSIHISFITLFELEYSFFNAPKEKKQEIQKEMQVIEQNFAVIPFQRKNAFIYGDIKKLIKDHKGTSSKGMQRHNIDLIVASTAITESCVLVAHDDIYKILTEIYPKFKYEDWTH